MKKIVSIIALVAVLFSTNGNAQTQKPTPKKKAKTEKTCSAEEMKKCIKDKKTCSAEEKKKCSKDKKAGCCAK